MSAVRVNGTRLWTNLMEMAKIGATKNNGSSRLALSPIDSEGRRKFLRDCSQLGTTVTSDAIGNMFVRYSPNNSMLDPVVIGSHLDTQPLGGRFDGVYGVLAGLEVLRTVHENNIETKHPIEVAVWTNEEGSRFPPSMMGSEVFVGKLPLDKALSTKDRDGITVGECLEKEGWAGTAPFGRKFDSYFEAHIEQGPVLEDEGLEIGVVTGGQAFRWIDASISGKAAHAGSTPMSLRQDALFALSEVALEMEKFAVNECGPDGKFTIGQVSIENSSRNVIASELNFTVDMRHPTDAVLDKMEARFAEIMQQVGEKRGVDTHIDIFYTSPESPFDETCVGLVESAAQVLELPYKRMISGAGHDAVALASRKHCPSTMVFIPCLNGISHNECESIEPEQSERGANVLLQAVLARAQVI